MPGTPIDLDAYLARIGHQGQVAPNLATLRELHALHPRAIAFENLSPFTGETPRLDPQSLEAKLVRGGRGGWCFEQNLLFSHVLTAIGFSYRRLAARVRWNVAPDVVTARSHCLLEVAIEGRDYLADVGFGGLVLTGPVEMKVDAEQETPHERHRLRDMGTSRRFEAQVAGEWQALYDFEMNEAKVPDYEVSNWYLANYPQSHFVTTLVAARAEADRRHALRGIRYSIHHADGKLERRFASSAAELLEWLEGPFGIRVPRSELLEQKISKLIEVERGQTPS
ncbi:MAG TPA: arylamine N-acetyltransferase [Usitatibacter sp.]|nr:arylamine N-acetyltransferase [Usitatibacter sp.]